MQPPENLPFSRVERHQAATTSQPEPPACAPQVIPGIHDGDAARRHHCTINMRCIFLDGQRPRLGRAQSEFAAQTALHPCAIRSQVNKGLHFGVWSGDGPDPGCCMRESNETECLTVDPEQRADVLQVGQAKLAEQLAEHLEQRILGLGCPKGLSLGNEAELTRAYGVSRWVVREAVAITERDGLTEMRRGRKGGLIVAASADDALAAALCNFLLFTRVDVRELMEVRKTVDRSLYILAAQSMDDARLGDALALLDNPPGETPTDVALAMYDQVLALSNNVFVGAFGISLSKLSGCLALLHEKAAPESGATPLADRLLSIRRRQLECVIAADQYGVVEASAAAAEAWIDYFEQPPLPRPHSRAARAQRTELIARRIAAVLNPGKTPRLPNIVATRIAMHILANRLEPGEAIALEPELMEMFNVGRPVLREAIRVLERDGFAQTEVGRHGGLKVGAPDGASVVNRAVNYLKLLGVTAADTDVLAAEMLILATDIATARLNASASPEDMAQVEAALREFQETDAAGFDARLFALGAALADVTRNSILRLFFRIVSGVRMGRLAGPPSDRDAVRAATSKLAEALRQGQISFARRAMAQIVNYSLRPRT
jgi:DNA-binding FadR family transcriptional regulator